MPVSGSHAAPPRRQARRANDASLAAHAPVAPLLPPPMQHPVPLLLNPHRTTRPGNTNKVHQSNNAPINGSLSSLAGFVSPQEAMSLAHATLLPPAMLAQCRDAFAFFSEVSRGEQNPGAADPPVKGDGSSTHTPPTVSCEVLHHMLNEALGVRCALSVVRDAVLAARQLDVAVPLSHARRRAVSSAANAPRHASARRGGPGGLAMNTSNPNSEESVAGKAASLTKARMAHGSSLRGRSLGGTRKAATQQAPPDDDDPTSINANREEHAAKGGGSSGCSGTEAANTSPGIAARTGIDFRLFVQILCMGDIAAWLQSVTKGGSRKLTGNADDAPSGSYPPSGDEDEAPTGSGAASTPHPPMEILVRTQLYPELDEDKDGVIGLDDLLHAMRLHTPYLLSSHSAHAEQEVLVPAPTSSRESLLPTQAQQRAVPVASGSSGSSLSPTALLREVDAAGGAGTGARPTTSSSASSSHPRASTLSGGSVVTSSPHTPSTLVPIEPHTEHGAAAASGTQECVFARKKRKEERERLLVRDMLGYIDEDGDGSVTLQDVVRVLNTN